MQRTAIRASVWKRGRFVQIDVMQLKKQRLKKEAWGWWILNSHQHIRCYFAGDTNKQGDNRRCCRGLCTLAWPLLVATIHTANQRPACLMRLNTKMGFGGLKGEKNAKNCRNKFISV